MLVRAYEYLAVGEDDRYMGFRLLASKVYSVYMGKIDKFSKDVQRVTLPPFRTINRMVLAELLDPQQGLPPAARAVIRSQLGIQGDSGLLPQQSTNSTASNPLLSPAAPSTNSPAQ